MKAGAIAVLAAMTAGLLATGAAPAAGPGAASDASQLAAARSAVAKALATPRLYRMTRTGEPMVSANVLEMCVDAQIFDRLTQGVGAPAADTPVTIDRKGCTLSFKRKRDGSFHMDNACDKAAGATRTWHTVLDGTVKDMRSSLEMAVENSRTGDTRIVAVEMRMVDIGACPADMTPGQERTADGRILDPPFRAARRGAPEAAPR